MSGDLEFRCACGSVTGVLHGVSPRVGIRYTCHCDDCQAYHHYLGASGRLDPEGGTDAYQTDGSRLKITSGLEKLATLKVAKLPLRPALRWYCKDCRTPLFATYDTGKRAFFVLLLATTEANARDRLLGPSTGLVWRKFAAGDVSDRKDANIGAILWRIMRRQVSARISGDYRNTPLFDPKTGAPIAAWRQLTPEERAAADASVKAYASARLAQ
jgi:hypothetical protein